MKLDMLFSMKIWNWVKHFERFLLKLPSNIISGNDMNPFTAEFLKWTLPFLHLGAPIVANGGGEK